MTSGGDGPTLTLMAFLTTTCAPCGPFWEMLAAGAPGRELGVQTVVVTPSRSMEDERAARRLTPPGVLLHMGSETWFDYGVAQAGTFVLVRSPTGATVPWTEAGEVMGSATPRAPSEVEGLVRRWLGGPA